MTALIIGILDAQAKLIAVLIQSQTPEQAKLLWDRYIEITEPLHKLLVKVEGLGQ
jgi:hypothetical protein